MRIWQKLFGKSPFSQAPLPVAQGVDLEFETRLAQILAMLERRRNPHRAPVLPADHPFAKYNSLADMVTPSEWEALFASPHAACAIAPLMTQFRRDPSCFPAIFCNFLGKIGTPEAAQALEEIVERFRHTTDHSDFQYWMPYACHNLVSLMRDSRELQRRHSTNLPFLVGNALQRTLSADEPFELWQALPVDKTAVLPYLLDCYQHAIVQGHDPAAVCKAIERLQLPESLEPVVTFFRSAARTPIDEEGTPTARSKGVDGQLATTLVSLPGALEKLPSLCSAEEYERLLVLAYHYGHRLAPALLEALALLATPRTAGCLVDALHILHLHLHGRNSERQASIHASVVQALVRVGTPAHAPLLATLRTRASDRGWLTRCRKDALEILGRTGNESHIPAIEKVMKEDATVNAEARRALAALAQRRAP